MALGTSASRRGGLPFIEREKFRGRRFEDERFFGGLSSCLLSDCSVFEEVFFGDALLEYGRLRFDDELDEDLEVRGDPLRERLESWARDFRGRFREAGPFASSGESVEASSRLRRFGEFIRGGFGGVSRVGWFRSQNGLQVQQFFPLPQFRVLQQFFNFLELG